jgi:hypothetical protein
MRFEPRETNISKLMLIGAIWGIALDPEIREKPTAELRRAIVRPLMLTASLSAVLVFVIAVAGAIGDNGFLRSGLWFVRLLESVGIWKVLLLLTSLAVARRVWTWLVRYRSVRLDALMDLPESSALVTRSVQVP